MTKIRLDRKRKRLITAYDEGYKLGVGNPYGDAWRIWNSGAEMAFAFEQGKLDKAKLQELLEEKQ